MTDANKLKIRQDFKKLYAKFRKENPGVKIKSIAPKLKLTNNQLNRITDDKMYPSEANLRELKGLMETKLVELPPGHEIIETAKLNRLTRDLYDAKSELEKLKN